MFLNTGEEETVLRAKLAFFQSVRDFLGIGPAKARSFTGVDERMLDANATNMVAIPTDESMSALVVCDMVVATVFCRRDQGNYVQVYFALYLDPPSLERILGFRCMKVPG